MQNNTNTTSIVLLQRVNINVQYDSQYQEIIDMLLSDYAVVKTPAEVNHFITIKNNDNQCQLTCDDELQVAGDEADMVTRLISIIDKVIKLDTGFIALRATLAICKQMDNEQDDSARQVLLISNDNTLGEAIHAIEELNAAAGVVGQCISHSRIYIDADDNPHFLALPYLINNKLLIHQEATSVDNKEISANKKPLSLSAIKGHDGLFKHKQNLHESFSDIQFAPDAVISLCKNKNKNKLEALKRADLLALLISYFESSKGFSPRYISLIKKWFSNIPAYNVTFKSSEDLQDFFAALVPSLQPSFSPIEAQKFALAMQKFNQSTVQNNKPLPVPEATKAKPNPNKKIKLSIGMATFDDYDGVYFSIQAIRLFHPEVLDVCEFIVIDNNPTSETAAELKKLETSIANYRYIPYTKKQSTTVKNEIFKEAVGEYVLCMDCHVLIVPGALQKLLDYYESNENCSDLLQGPLLHDNLTTLSSHFTPKWNKGMYGTWGYDNRAANIDNPPFDIPMQGCGLFSCRTDAWLGFNEKFKGFGGEEGYIHEKYRQAGHRALCLPFLRWMHRFTRIGGAKYENRWEDRIRNYLIGHQELNLDTSELKAHFVDLIGEAEALKNFERVQQELSE